MKYKKFTITMISFKNTDINRLIILLSPVMNLSEKTTVFIEHCESKHTKLSLYLTKEIRRKFRINAV